MFHIVGKEYVMRAIPELEKSIGTKIEYQLAEAGDTRRLKSIAEKTGVNNQIIFRKIIPHKEIISWLYSLSVHIHTTMLERVFKAIVEAMSCGLPYVAFDQDANSVFIFWWKQKQDFRGNCSSCAIY